MMTLMHESLESRLWRWGGNLFPAYRRTGARITYVAPDFHEVRIRIPSNWATRNHMGITWGGGLYASLDPIYGVMLYKILGGQHRVVDKTARIDFKRPGKTTLFAHFRIAPQEVADIKHALKGNTRLQRRYLIDLCDRHGVVHVSCEKVLCIFPQTSST